MKRSVMPIVSAPGEQFLYVYEQKLRTQGDLTTVSIRNYLSDLCHSIAWRKFWDMIPWIPPGSMSKEQNKMYRTQ